LTHDHDHVLQDDYEHYGYDVANLLPILGARRPSLEEVVGVVGVADRWVETPLCVCDREREDL